MRMQRLTPAATRRRGSRGGRERLVGIHGQLGNVQTLRVESSLQRASSRATGALWIALYHIRSAITATLRRVGFRALRIKRGMEPTGGLETAGLLLTKEVLDDHSQSVLR